MSAVMLLLRTNGSLLLVQRTVTRTIVLQETIGKDALAYGMAEWSQAANPREIREKNSQVTAGAVSHCQEKHDVREQKDYPMDSPAAYHAPSHICEQEMRFTIFNYQSYSKDR
ncbi:hypothetical protein STEG23_004388 [Scotinomys teguina]